MRKMIRRTYVSLKYCLLQRLAQGIPTNEKFRSRRTDDKRRNKLKCDICVVI